MSVRIVRDLHRDKWGRRRETAVFMCSDENRGGEWTSPKSMPTLEVHKFRINCDAAMKTYSGSVKSQSSSRASIKMLIGHWRER